MTEATDFEHLHDRLCRLARSAIYYVVRKPANGCAADVFAKSGGNSMRRLAKWAINIFVCLAAVSSVACTGYYNTTNSTPTADHANCAAADSAALSTCWEQVAPLGSGGFPPEAGSHDSPKWEPGRWPLTLEPVVGFNNDLWMMSQTNAWSSSDGLNWTHYQKADWGERISQGYVFFGGRLWMFGGLRYADRVPLNDVWSSADGVAWAKVGNADWSPRKAHTIIVFQNKLWLFGGADRVKRDFSTEHALNDVWSSADGLHWTQVTAAAPWSPREGAKVLVFKDALYLLGGRGQADVWRSDAGANWTQLSPQAEWRPRHDYAAIVFGDKLWIYAGWEGKPSNALNDIWYSTDGNTWVRQTEHAPWAPRSPRTIVYKDKLWIFSGKHTGGKDSWGGDIWTMTSADSTGLRRADARCPRMAGARPPGGCPGPRAAPADAAGRAPTLEAVPVKNLSGRASGAGHGP